MTIGFRVSGGLGGVMRVMVSAGGSGIGLAIAKAFFKEGAQISICDADPMALDWVQRDYPDWSIIEADVTDEAAVDFWFDAFRVKEKGLDVLVNNAGIAGPIGPVEEIGFEGWKKCLAVGLDGQFLCARRAVPVMKRQKAGSIINVSSTSGLYGVGLRTPYSAAKWGVIGLTKSLAIELGPFNVRVNAICPGSVAGERIERVIAAEAESRKRTPDEVRAEYVSGQSIKRFPEAEEIADLCVFLASDKAKMISGQALPIDGNTETYHMG